MLSLWNTHRLFDDFFPVYDYNQFSPSLDVKEDEKAFYIEAELPGINQNDVKITVDKGVLIIEGSKERIKEEKTKYHTIERSYGTFTRSFRLPDSVDNENIEAVYKNGLLTLTLTKIEKEKPKQISVNIS